MTESLFLHVPRVRFTTHLPFGGPRIGPTIWVGSVARGWVGKSLRPSLWNATWRIRIEEERSNP